ncbi:hypothetical protein E1A91_D01G044400v1 [Gossypium mustelinum]|uniref:Knottins-like domain-containing protein n=1 Tax=Gossypium mustelinum TaxID=34275 RepID=A0A5D2W2Q6_GOSMU|nr:hypothetical protein E1A91_D01G044400v1 [Gossypium mustelinum]
MKGSSRPISTLVLLMLILLATEIGTMADEEHKICESKSGKFKGMCFLDANCDSICKAEPGSTGGHCHGIFRICYCTKPC